MVDRYGILEIDVTKTGRPKGVVTRHSALSSQVSTVAETWQWTEKVSPAKPV
jgi:malonyl-CoA/methylmalonyl-CoA synthetase